MILLLFEQLILKLLLNLFPKLGFALVLVLFAGLRERLEGAPIPEVFKGSPISLITAGMMALAFMGFSGLVKI